MAGETGKAGMDPVMPPETWFQWFSMACVSMLFDFPLFMLCCRLMVFCPGEQRVPCTLNNVLRLEEGHCDQCRWVLARQSWSVCPPKGNNYAVIPCVFWIQPCFNFIFPSPLSTGVFTSLCVSVCERVCKGKNRDASWRSNWMVYLKNKINI